jgi:hypothetical protein
LAQRFAECLLTQGCRSNVGGGQRTLLVACPSTLSRVSPRCNFGHETRGLVDLSRSRALVFGGLAAAAVGVFIAVALAFSAATTSGVAAAQAVRLQTVRRTVHIDGHAVIVTTKPSGSVCFTGPHVSGCAASLADTQLAYATGKLGSRMVLAGVAGPNVKAVIARLSRKGTVWPTLHTGAFYAVLPHGRRLTSIVKVLSGGRRVAFHV